jgi:hypothetical protein
MALGCDLREWVVDPAGANAAVVEAKPLHDNGYMVQVARILVQRAVIACGKGGICLSS